MPPCLHYIKNIPIYQTSALRLDKKFWHTCSSRKQQECGVPFFDSFARKIRIADPVSLICPVLPAKQIISHDHKRCRRNHKKKGCRQYQGPGHAETHAEQHETA